MKKEEKEKKEEVVDGIVVVEHGTQVCYPSIWECEVGVQGQLGLFRETLQVRKQGLKMAHAQALKPQHHKNTKQKENKKKYKILHSLSISFSTAETFPSAQEPSTPSLSILQVSAEGA